MTLNFTYLLFFKHENLWEALQGVGDIAEPYDHPPTTIHFPDRDLILPLMTGLREQDELQHEKAEFNFTTSLIFKEDEAILEHLADNGVEDDRIKYTTQSQSTKRGTESRRTRP